MFKDFKIFNGTEFIDAHELLVDGEKISAVGNGLDAPDAEVIEGYGKILSPGFVDLHAHFRDPGGEWNEDIASGQGPERRRIHHSCGHAQHKARDIRTLPRGVCAQPWESGGRIEDTPAGCVSKNREGKEMAELLKMAEAGAVFFTDDGLR